MKLSDDTGPDAPYAHDRDRTRHGRHGRPGPFGGRLRLPTLRFSGAAMAMSTVVGISIATTFLLNEQQGVGRRAGVARVGSSAPPPSSGTSPDAASGPGGSTASGTGTLAGQDSAGPGPSAGRRPAAPATPAPGASGTPAPGTRAPGTVPGPRASTPPAPHPGGGPSTAPLADGRAPRHGVTAGPQEDGTGPGGSQGSLADELTDGSQSADEPFATDGTGAQTARRPGEDPAPSGASPSPSPSPSKPVPSPSPSAPRPFVPSPSSREWTGGILGTADGATVGSDGTDGTGAGRPAGAPEEGDDQALAGTAAVQSLGRDGTRHVLALTVTEPLTALQAEIRLAPGTAAPGTGAAWTDLAGAVVTSHQDHGAVVYRFTTPPGTDVRAGRYTFTVRGTRPAGHAARPATAAPPRSTDRRTAERHATARRSPESWSASAFGIGRPRAVAALGAFAAPAPVPVPAPAPHAAAPAG
ncbi:hypothetical protein ACFVVL_21150 [Kitasatospora sp. NPDC058115]|uniref:hypothetical protein n=1 Tax=Kitasatospora sp. NPDC058115 TaxID=3346347 RepID=UPI0036DB7B39